MRVVRVVLAGVALVVGFPVAAGADGPPNPSAPQSPMCAAVHAYWELGRRYEEFEWLVPLDAAALADRLADRETRLADVIQSADDDLLDDLERLDDVEGIVGAAVLDQWGTDGVELARQADNADSAIEVYVLPDGVLLASGEQQWDNVRDLRREISEELSWRCDERPDDWVSVNDLPPPEALPADLRYAFQRLVNGNFEIAFGAPGREAVPLPNSSGLQQTNPDVSPDGKWLTAAALDGHYLGPLDSPEALTRVEAMTGTIGCTSWSPDSTRIVFSGTTADGDRGHRLYDVTTGETSDLLASAGECPAFYDDDTVMLTELDEHLSPAIVVDDLDSGRDRPIGSIDDCAEAWPQRRPTTDEISLLTACSNYYLAGLWIVPPSGPPRHLLTGRIGAPAWSPDGQWILFGFSEDRNADPELWIASADGLTAMKLEDDWATWPSWIPAGAECALCPTPMD